jgi:hypothetical protein
LIFEKQETEVKGRRQKSEVRRRKKGVHQNMGAFRFYERPTIGGAQLSGSALVAEGSQAGTRYL